MRRYVVLAFFVFGIVGANLNRDDDHDTDVVEGAGTYSMHEAQDQHGVIAGADDWEHVEGTSRYFSRTLSAHYDAVAKKYFDDAGLYHQQPPWQPGGEVSFFGCREWEWTQPTGEAHPILFVPCVGAFYAPELQTVLNVNAQYQDHDGDGPSHEPEAEPISAAEWLDDRSIVIGGREGWMFDPTSNYFWHAATKHFFDPASMLYYSYELGRWTPTLEVGSSSKDDEM